MAEAQRVVRDALSLDRTPAPPMPAVPTTKNYPSSGSNRGPPV